MDFNSPPPCPSTVTVRRNPHRRARETPKYTPQSFNLREIPQFPNDDVLAAVQTPEVPSISLQKPENENLRVFLRIRTLSIPSPNQAPRVRAKSVWPQNPAKKSNAAAGTITSKKKSSGSCIVVNHSQSVTLSTPSDLQESKRTKLETYGGFSHVFSSDSSQFEVYERMVKPMVEEFLKGRSGMLAALGPSGSGKTHTVFGSTRDPGMVPLTLRHIFKDTESDAKQSSRSFYLSIFEIYTERGKAEKLFDLLPDGGELSMQQSTIKGLQEVVISNAEQAELLIAQAIVKRATAMTKTNSQSSRSQCIINIRDAPQGCKGVVNPKSNIAVLTIIDLAGAEREKRTGNQGTRLVESNFINNTLMVLGLCLRSLLEHQKNPKKPLQKHFQNSLLTRYMRDYLLGKKRMTLILTAKSGEEDYLDTSYLLRQASPFMHIKYNEVEQANMATKKRHHQAVSAVEFAKPSPVLEQRKRKKLGISEQTLQNDKPVVEECNTSKEDASTVCKLDATGCASFKSECDSRAASERSHIIMRNFAKVLWNVLKQYNSEVKVAEKEIQSLKESIAYEKEKNLVLETELNVLKACCTCCKREKGTFYPQESSEARFDQSDEELTLGTSCTWEDWVSLTKPGHNNTLEVENVGKISSETFCVQASSVSRLDQRDEETTLDQRDGETALDQRDEETILSQRDEETILDPRDEDATLDQRDEETILGQRDEGTTLDQKVEETILGQRDEDTALDQRDEETILDQRDEDAMLDRRDEETTHDQRDEETILGQRDEETILGQRDEDTTLDQRDEETILGQRDEDTTLDQRDEETILGQRDEDATLERRDEETTLDQRDEDTTLDQRDEETTVGTSWTLSDSEKSDREIGAPLSNLGQHDALEVEAATKIPSETSCIQESSESTIDESDQEPTLGTSCTQLDFEKSTRDVEAALSEDSEPGCHNALEIEATVKIPSGLLVSSTLTKDGVLDSSSPKDVSLTTCDPVADSRGETGVKNSCKPPKPKRTLLPSSSVLSRIVAFDLVDENEKVKGTRKLASTASDQIRSNGSISLLRLLQSKSNLHQKRNH